MDSLALDERIHIATNEPIPSLPPLTGDPADPIDTRYVWNEFLAAPPDTIGFVRDTLQAEPVSPPRADPDQQTSIYMMGDIGIQIIFPESDDEEICDPPESYAENWTAPELALAYASILRAHVAWFGEPDLDRGIKFAFPSPILVNVSVEPIERPWNDGVWKNEIYDWLDVPPGGQNGTDVGVRGFLLNNDLRTRDATDWYIHIFVVRDVCDEDGNFEGSTLSAFAYSIYGPFSVITSTLAIPDFVSTHETAHLFGAADEYHGAPTCDAEDDCEKEWGYLQVPNQNCVHCGNQQACLMGGSGSQDGWPICEWTRGQLGWRDSDGDGLFDPIDHPESGAVMFLENTDDPLRPGDRIVINDHETSMFVKHLAVSNRRSDMGRIVWDGIDYAGNRATLGLYYLYRNASEWMGALLVEDSEAPVLSDVSLTGMSGLGDVQLLEFTLEDEDTHGCNVSVETHLSGMHAARLRHISDDFRYDREGQDGIEKLLVVDRNRPGVYDMDLLVTDVGGGHNAARTISFQVGTSAGLTTGYYIPEIRLERGVPNPTAGWISWKLDGIGGGLVSMRIVGVNGRAVRAWGKRTLPDGEMVLLWDGRDDSGRPVAGGKYFLIVDAGDATRVVGSAVVVR